MRVPSIRAMAGLPERKLGAETPAPSWRDTINKYKKEFTERWEDEQIRAKTFEAARSKSSSGGVDAGLRASFAGGKTGSGAAGAGKRVYKRPIVVYEDEVASVVRKENEFAKSQRGSIALEPERRRRARG